MVVPTGFEPVSEVPKTSMIDPLHYGTIGGKVVLTGFAPVFRVPGTRVVDCWTIGLLFGRGEGIRTPDPLRNGF